MTDYTYPDPLLSPNARVHWAKRAKIVKAARTDAYWITKAACIRPEIGEVPMAITIYPPDNRKRDRENAQAACKAMIDGIADAWKLDDNCFRIEWRWGPVVSGGRVTVELIDAAAPTQDSFR